MREIRLRFGNPPATTAPERALVRFWRRCERGGWMTYDDLLEWAMVVGAHDPDWDDSHARNLALWVLETAAYIALNMKQTHDERVSFRTIEAARAYAAARMLDHYGVYGPGNLGRFA